MKKNRSFVVFSLVMASASLGAGCDAGKEPFLKGAQAEEKGDYAGAAPHYEEVCTKKSPLCEAAQKRKARLSIKTAWKAVGEGRYKDAKTTLDSAQSSPDTVTAGEAAALLALPELVQGILYEEALAQADKGAALKGMEAIASEPSALAPKAQEWIQKNRPGLLLAEAKAACAPGGKSSCVLAARKLAALHPESAEAKEAEGLALANDKRLFPLFRELEGLLIQRVSVYDKEQKIELCKGAGGAEEECTDKHSTSPVPALSYLSGFWGQKLTGVDDPYYKQLFDARWEKAGQGIYDQETWPKL